MRFSLDTIGLPEWREIVEEMSGDGIQVVEVLTMCERNYTTWAAGLDGTRVPRYGSARSKA